MPTTKAIEIIARLLESSGKTSIFRGQGGKWSLLPKALRPPLNEGKHEEAIEVFRLGCIAAGYEARGDLIDIAVAQHHGLATNLLDWTTNPMVALFFACSQKQDEDGAVFILNKPEFVSEEEEKKDNWKNIKGLRLYNPRLIDARFACQKGLFTVQNDEKAVGDIVSRDELRVEEITFDLKKQFIELLYAMGIDRSTLFPGLDGLCDRINWETENRIVRNFPLVAKARAVYLSVHVVARSVSSATLSGGSAETPEP